MGYTFQGKRSRRCRRKRAVATTDEADEGLKRASIMHTKRGGGALNNGKHKSTKRDESGTSESRPTNVVVAE